MLSWLVTILVIGLFAGIASEIAWILFLVFPALFAINLLMGKCAPPSMAVGQGTVNTQQGTGMDDHYNDLGQTGDWEKGRKEPT